MFMLYVTGYGSGAYGGIRREMKCACGLSLWRNVGVGVVGGGGENGWAGGWDSEGCVYGAWRMRMSSRMVYSVCVGDTGGGRRIPSGLRIAVRWALGARHGGGVVRGEVCEVV